MGQGQAWEMAFLELHKTDWSVCLCLRGWPTCSFFRFGPPQWLSAHFQDPCSSPLAPDSPIRPSQQEHTLVFLSILCSPGVICRPIGKVSLQSTLGSDFRARCNGSTSKRVLAGPGQGWLPQARPSKTLQPSADSSSIWQVGITSIA